MADYTDEELGLSPEQTEQLDPGIRDELRKSRSRAREASEWQRRAETAERKNVLLDLGIDETKPLGKLFVKGYDGEWTADHVRAAAEEVPGLLPEKSGTDQMTAEEEEALRRVAASSSTSGAGGPDLRSNIAAELAQAKSPEEVMAIIDRADPSLGVVRKGFQ